VRLILRVTLSAITPPHLRSGETASDFSPNIDMFIDGTHFPLVWMQIATPGKNPEDSSFAELEALLARKEVFVLLNDEGLDKGNHEHSPEEMKQTSLWMQSHKSDLQGVVKASVHIEPSIEKRPVSKASAVVHAKSRVTPCSRPPPRRGSGIGADAVGRRIR